MRKTERYKYITAYFQQAMPNAQTELHYDSPFQLLVAVMLSAQCTDKRVNMTTPALFEVFPTSASLAAATFEEVYDLIHSISYPNSKARHLISMAQKLESDFGGEVPTTLEQLTSLPGVGRKTANVVMSVAFGKTTIAVDTHVFRVSHRIGLVSAQCTTPLSVERELTKYIPPHLRHDFHHWLILHGRYVCKAIHPLCGECGICQWCQSHKDKL
ncbi:MAG: endonuclease III [Bacteroidaceae bacterium]|nr:endonuclease III [Bacteroidaceae bacterium]